VGRDRIMNLKNEWTEPDTQLDRMGYDRIGYTLNTCWLKCHLAQLSAIEYRIASTESTEWDKL